MKKAQRVVIETVMSGTDIIRVPMNHKRWINTNTSETVSRATIEAMQDAGFVKVVKVEGSINRWKIEVTEAGKAAAGVK